MQRCDVTIATRNPKTYYLLIKILKALNLEFVSCTPDSGLANDARVVVTTKVESVDGANGTVVLVEEEPDPMTASVRIMCAYFGISNPKEAIIGVDPGMRFGLALVIDGNVIYTKTVTSPPSAANLAQKLVKHLDSLFPESALSIRLGTGSRLYSALFLRSLGELTKNTNIELVDEKHTTIPNGYTKDQLSAILISGRPGRPPSPKDTRLTNKRGYIRSLRNLVRRLSDNKKRMSVKEARKVLQGESSLDDFIDIDP
ncbi:hypothetical protein EU537_06300 [Candidatus Thorarchaeota archaeon]|nr:MAG: hypothetical protein EU537_06300 [Candidatus Thorarchaeota archaeon]